MNKVKIFFLILMTMIIFSSQSQAAEVKPLFGISKWISNEADDYLIEKWTRLDISDEAAKIYPKLSKAVIEYNNERHNNAQARYKKYREESKELSELSGELRQFYDRNDIIVRRADSIVLSLLEMNADYTGGVHGMYGYFGVNFDSVTGKQLKISDVCTNAEVLVKSIVTRLIEDSPQSPFSNAEEIIMEQVIKDTINFTIDPDGVSFYFNPYLIGSYAEGLYTAKLLFNEYPNLFKKKFQQIPKNYCQTLPLYDTNVVSIKNGMRNYINVSLNDEGNYKIDYGEGVAEDETGLQGIQPPVHVHINGNDYLYIDGYINDVGRRLHVYRLNDDNLELIEVMPYTFKNIGLQKYETWWIPTDPNNIRFDSMQGLGANGDIKSHFGGIDDDGSFSFG